MTEFLKRMKRQNTPSGYHIWVRKHGAKAESTATPDTLRTEQAKSGIGGGLSAELLHEKGLASAGYARFIQNEAARDFERQKTEYEKELAEVKEKNLSAYARYLTSHRQAQTDLQRTMIERIGRGESFDTENAYQIALAAGLTDPNARAAAELGVAAAKERASSRLLTMILEERLQDYRAKAYALKMGFTEEEAEKFAQYAKEINSTKIPSKLPSDLFN